MSDTNAGGRANRATESAAKHPTFHVHNCPQKLIDRANAKAALKGKGVSEWVVEVLERETKRLKALQDEYNSEEEK